MDCGDTFGERIGSDGAVIPESRYLPPESLTPGLTLLRRGYRKRGPGARLLARCRRLRQGVWIASGGLFSKIDIFLTNG